MAAEDALMASFESLSNSAPSDLSNSDWLTAESPSVDYIVPDITDYDADPATLDVPAFAAPARADSFEAAFSSATFDEPATSAASWEEDFQKVPDEPVHTIDRKVALAMRRVETSASALTALDEMPEKRKEQAPARGRNTTASTSPPKDLGVDTRTVEQKRADRKEALLRYKEKKRNRTFKKTVRYECRKQLADSRPRVKGRFVKKNEISLYKKYGDEYREHLDELEIDDGVVPSL
mmetsp:Transcript_30885/g.75491  ORF Transcript_30885/g.75491 Transcript_30885/m.75491 type:complete len:236 (-) Transcript_30885:107-814(-)|eukprot:CAMPEP_0198310940 /NCGR_PEP_ID=MMETSP1450-20131203/2827_1 /TAXON_ID=753684 ORGANISM="Madagascaria erythrocladiodes, Strain CCMP3234" /NCGR_SAMPLE_ID=MMETSP1450 /ASSEMBLY_ACC=CAM_ASM_001115 /LENGTH=235 /DNA_ID=CAMNT_0044013795 /DNA_START=221 /DNA_END=928 /DNA_ORIENTATION=+